MTRALLLTAAALTIAAVGFVAWREYQRRQQRQAMTLILTPNIISSVFGSTAWSAATRAGSAGAQ